jgi:hypothetical protein
LARIDFIPPYGDSHLTAIINFSLPLGKNRFHSALWRFTPHGDYQFFFASWQELISFHLMVIHASRRYRFFFASWQESISFRLMAIHASRRYQFSLRLTAIIDFSLPHGKNRFHSASWQFTPHGDNRFSLPQGKNRFHSALWRFTPHGDNQFFPRKVLLITHQGIL